MNNTELTLDQLSEVSGGAPHITTWEGLTFKSSKNFLGPISGEGVFKPSNTAALGPISGEGVFKPSTNPRGSVIVGDNHFRRINNF